MALPGPPANYGYPWHWMTDPANAMITPWSWYGLTPPASQYGATGVENVQAMNAGGGEYGAPSWYQPYNVGQNWQGAMEAAQGNYGGMYPGWYSAEGKWMGSSIPSGSAAQPTSYYYSPTYGIGGNAMNQAGMRRKIGAKGTGVQSQPITDMAQSAANAKAAREWRLKRMQQMGGVMGAKPALGMPHSGGGQYFNQGQGNNAGTAANWVQNMVNWRP